MRMISSYPIRLLHMGRQAPVKTAMAGGFLDTGPILGYIYHGVS